MLIWLSGYLVILVICWYVDMVIWLYGYLVICC